MKKTNFWRGMTALFTLLFTLTMFGQSLAFHREGDVNLFLGTLPPAMEVSDDTNYYPSSYASKDEMRDALRAHLIEAQEEDNAAEVLAEFERVQRLSKVQNGSYAYVKTWFLNRYKEDFQQEETEEAIA